MTSKKRFGIFVFYDKSGIVKKYVKHLLGTMKGFLSEYCIVCNGHIEDESKVWLETNSNYVFYRENKGYDAEAYQDAILNRLGMTKLREFDELVLFNNSFYGPVYSFEDMFEIMEQKKVDFWGITAYEGSNIPYHIQSYFLVIEDRLLTSIFFEEYWRCQKECNTLKEAIKNFELKITAYFMEQGFSCSTYIDYHSAKEEYGIERDLLNIANYELLTEKRCPIVKRKYIMWSLEDAVMQNRADILSYINDYTDYNIEYIWEDLIKEYSPYEITTYRNLNNYLTDSINDGGIFAGLEDVCVVIDSAQPEQFIDYLMKMSHEISTVVCTDELLEYENIELIKKNGQSFWKLLVIARNLKRDAKYFCVLKDSEIVREKVAEKRRNYYICRNIVNSINYIIKVKKLFEQQPYLGALFVEEIFDDNFLLNGFNKQYLSEESALVLNKIGCQALSGEQCISYSGCFWVKTDILDVIEKNQILFENVSGQKILEMFPYYVKAAGLYSGLLHNIDVVAKEYMWKNILLNELMENVVFFDESHIERQILEENILQFINRFHDIYIYGAGKYAKRLIYFLERKGIAIKGIVVTIKMSDSYFMGYPISEVSEVQLNEKVGVIVAMSKRNQKEIKDKIKWNSEENIYYI